MVPSQKSCSRCGRTFWGKTTQKHCGLACSWREKVSRGKPGECWEWTASLDRGGYGDMRFLGKTYKAHRLAYEFFNGPPQSHVLHACDNPSCVNPEHLFEGTQADNMADMNQKGRHVKGEDCNLSKMTEASVRELRLRREEGATYQEAADMLGISIGTAWAAINRKTWQHV